MIFKALPVNVGDSFYLENKGTRILVDGGMNKAHIISLLDKENIPNKHLDVLICTHYDADHINGIIGILQSGKYSFKELWLPEILGSIGYSINKNIREVISKIRDFKSSDIERIEGIDLPYNPDANNEEIENISFNLLKRLRSKYHHYHFFLGHDSETSMQMFTSLLNISNLITLSYSSGSFVRWFKYEDNLLHNSVNFDLYAKNCVQTGLTEYSSDQLFQALLKVSLSKINKEALVFQYEKDNYPNILFTADSDLSFCGNNQISLADNSIVTAPHHGSATNNSAYNYIIGTDLVYVRSYSHKVKIPGTGYISQNPRHCTRCINEKCNTKVELQFNGSSFIPQLKTCTCI